MPAAVAPAKMIIFVLIKTLRVSRWLERQDAGITFGSGIRSAEPDIKVSCADLFAPEPALLHLLLDRTTEREQALVDRCRYFADKSDHTLAVLEDPSFPQEGVAELVDLGLLGPGRALQRLHRERVGADFLGRLALLARHSLDSAHDRGALGVERIEQAREQQLAGGGLVGRGSRKEIRDRLLGIIERRAPRGQFLHQCADLG